MQKYSYAFYSDELYHYGILGMKWGVRRYQNDDGSLTSLGKIHYGIENIQNASNRFWKIANDPLWMETQLERIGSKSKSAANSIMNGIKALNDPFFSEYFRTRIRQLNNNPDISDLSNAKTMRELTETIFEYNSPLINGKDFVLSTFSDPNSPSNNVLFEDLAQKSIDVSDRYRTNGGMNRTISVTAPNQFTIPGVNNNTQYGLSPEGGNKKWNIELLPSDNTSNIDKSMAKQIVDAYGTERMSELRKRYSRIKKLSVKDDQAQYRDLNKLYEDVLDYYKDPYAY